MPPPPLSRVVRELSHVSVEYFVPRPGTALRASQDARRTPRPRHALALALALAPSPRALVNPVVRGAGVSLFFLSHMHADHLQGLHHGWSAVTTPT